MPRIEHEVVQNERLETKKLLNVQNNQGTDLTSRQSNVIYSNDQS